MKVLIVVAGCDASSRFIVDIDPSIGILVVAEACNRAAMEERPCMPMMSVVNAVTFEVLAGPKVEFSYPSRAWRRIFTEAGLPVPKECEEEDE